MLHGMLSENPCNNLERGLATALKRGRVGAAK